VVGGAGASFVLGSFAIASCSPDPAALAAVSSAGSESDDKAKAFAPNGFTRLDPDGAVTITICKSDMGQGVRTSLAMLAAEEMDADWSTVKVVQAPGGSTQPAGQGTGGSSSIRNLHEQMRRMGGATRLMLISAAAKQWGIDAGGCRTESGKVIAPDGRSIRYGELTALAAAEPVPTDVKLKDPSQFKILGKSVRKIDGPAIVTGTAIYGIDAKVEGMVFASVARPPVIGGSVASFDDSAARKVPGVLDVQKFRNGVAVFGTNTWATFAGREALKIVWSDGADPSLSSATVTEKLKAAIIDHPEMPSGSRVISATYDLPFLAHATMEPMNALADVKEDSCRVWASTQVPDGAQRMVARMLGLPPEKVTINVTLLGGGFGRRLNPDYIGEAVELSKMAKKPVKLTWTREDDMKNDNYRPACHHSLKGAVDGSGKPVGWSHQAIQAQGRRQASDSFGDAGIAYDIPNAGLRFTGVGAGVSTGAWRSVENTLLNVVNECFLDELAHAAGTDPFEFRRGLIRDKRLLAVLELAAKNAGWGTPLPKGWGRGIACFGGYGSYVAHVAEVSVIDGKIKAERIVAVVDCGTAITPKGVEAMMQGGISDGLSTALRAEITVAKGAIVQNSWTDYKWMSMDAMPKVEVTMAPSGGEPGGMGEPPYPSVAPSVANAVFAATGKRVRKFPIRLDELA
jgi:isoquinoline 1-oxidoreductase beta subunit